MNINYREFYTMYLYFYELNLLDLPLKEAVIQWVAAKEGGNV